MNNHPASWRMPTAKQMEKASGRLRPPGIDDPPPDGALPQEYWEALLRDPRAEMRLSDIPRELLRVKCRRCARTIEIQRLDAVKLFGPHAVWKDVGQRLLDDGCQARTGRLEEDGCWPDWTR
jgi:hypothetical protein